MGSLFGVKLFYLNILEVVVYYEKNLIKFIFFNRLQFQSLPDNSQV